MKRLMSVLAAAALCMGTASAAPVQWSVNGHWYEAVSAPGITWTDAKAAAEAAGGYLATLTSLAESDFVYNALAVGGQPLWLGGTQATTATSAADGWEWVTGEAWSFTNWAAGEPNNFGNERSLAFAFFSAGKWNNAPTGYTGYTNGGYIVERLPEPASLALVGAALVGLGLVRRKRQS